MQEHVAVLEDGQFQAPQLRLRWRGDLPRENYGGQQPQAPALKVGEEADSAVALEDLEGVCESILEAAGHTMDAAEGSAAMDDTDGAGGAGADKRLVWATHLKMCITSATRAARAESSALAPVEDAKEENESTMSGGFHFVMETADPRNVFNGTKDASATPGLLSPTFPQNTSAGAAASGLSMPAVNQWGTYYGAAGGGGGQ